MSLYALGGAMISEQLAAIREIARNLLADGPPAGTAPASPASGPADASWTTFPQDGSAFLGQAAADPRAVAPSGAFSLLGIRRPLMAPGQQGAAGLAEAEQLIRLLSGANADAMAAGRPTDQAGAMPAEGSPAGSGLADTAANEGEMVRLASGAAAPEASLDLQQPATILHQRQQADAPSAPAATAAQATDPARMRPQGVDMPPERRTADASAGDRTARRSGALAAPGAVAEGRIADLAVQKGSPAEALAMLGFPGGGAELAGLAVERAGIFASFILNAHMLPGWPPPLPFAVIPEDFQAARASIVPQLSPNEEQILVYLLNLGLNFVHIARILKTVRSVRRRSSLFMALASILSSTASVTHVMETELAAVIDDLMQEKKLRTRMLPGARLRTDLR